MSSAAREAILRVLDAEELNVLRLSAGGRSAADVASAMSWGSDERAAERVRAVRRRIRQKLARIGGRTPREGIGYGRGVGAIRVFFRENPGPHRSRDVARACGLPVQRVSERIWRMEKRGELVRVSRGVYKSA